MSAQRRLIGLYDLYVQAYCHKITYVVVSCGHDYCTDHKKPINPRYVYLSVKDLRRMHNFDLGKVRQLNDLRQ